MDKAPDSGQGRKACQDVLSAFERLERQPVDFFTADQRMAEAVVDWFYPALRGVASLADTEPELFGKVVELCTTFDGSDLVAFAAAYTRTDFVGLLLRPSTNGRPLVVGLHLNAHGIDWLKRNRALVEEIRATLATPTPGRLERSSDPGGESPQIKDGERAAHSPDFRSVNWFGTLYTFSATQAACVRVLWEAWEQKTPELGQEYILEQAESASPRLSALFGDNKAWGTMIISGTSKGSFRLQEPNTSES